MLPDKVNFDFLVVMGGPQSPATTVEECAHFDAAKEIAFIKAAINQGKIAFGVCLGAQLIGEALGATFEHSPNREIGVFPITPTDACRGDAVVESLTKDFMVGHWHGDMPGLAPDTKILATSAGCPRQIVRYSPKVYGFQCHLEFTRQAIEGLIVNNADELETNKGLPYIETPEQLRSHDYRAMNELLFTFLDNLAAQQSSD